MNKKRWAQVNAIFESALEKEDDQRDAYLIEACGSDRQLLIDVQRLLANDQSAEEGFLAPPALSAKKILPRDAIDQLIGQQFGVYEVKRKIGSGGMGNVYLATRKEDFKQRVAIKFLKRGMDSDEILKRFHREIRVLAALGQHPNIARLLDAGTTPQGTPYFVMEYVEGDEIDVFCDKNKLDINKRIKLFQAVCSAVHFAHQHTIIHRDIKPSNILVSHQGVPKLIDFGIAKLTAPELGGETAIQTSTEYRAMTPEYSSPEQVRGEAITTASDVYSLGVVFYQLLTGRRPYQIESRVPSEIEQIVCHQNPGRPSTVVGETVDNHSLSNRTANSSPEVLATNRGVNFENLKRSLRGDLDTIAMMALRKHPNERYASAGQFAVDLGRFLDGDLIVARRLGYWQRFIRTCRSYPVASSLITAVLIGSIFGLIYLSSLSRTLVRSSTLESVAQHAEMLQQGHKYYTNVIGEIKQQAPETADQLKPPATFTIELFQYLNRSDSNQGTLTGMRSRFPFSTRTNLPPLDEFEIESLDYFAGDSTKEEFYRFGDYQGQPYLRYARPMRMEQACCDCHNGHPDSTKTDWLPGQVRGIIEVARPLTNDIQRTYDGLQTALIWMSSIVLAVFAGTSILLGFFARR